MTKSEEYKIKQAEIDIINICRQAGISGNELVNIGFKLTSIQIKENEKGRKYVTLPVPRCP